MKISADDIKTVLNEKIVSESIPSSIIGYSLLGGSKTYGSGITGKVKKALGVGQYSKKYIEKKRQEDEAVKKENEAKHGDWAKKTVEAEKAYDAKRFGKKKV